MGEQVEVEVQAEVQAEVQVQVQVGRPAAVHSALC